MAIIGKIRKHSGLAVILVGVAIAAFVIGDFGKKRMQSTTGLAVINGEEIPYVDFNAQVDEAMENQKENTGSDKISDQDAYNIRQSVYNTMVKDIIMGKQLEELGLTVSPEELFDQIQGRQPHRLILQYFKDPSTGMYDPSLVLNYLKNLDQMEPKAKKQWLAFEKVIKEDRLQTKYNTLVGKGYYLPRAFAEKEYQNNVRSLKIRYIVPPFYDIPDSIAKITDADYEKFYEKTKSYFYSDEPYREMDFVVFDVLPSATDRQRIAADVQQLYRDFEASNNPISFVFANTDSRIDSMFLKKGTLPGLLDSLMFNLPVGSFIPPFEHKEAWYMAKLLDVQERPDSIKGSHILISYQGQGIESVTRTKEQAKKMADSVEALVKRNPERFTELAKSLSDYPTAKEDGGDLKWMADGNPGFSLFFDAAVKMQPNELKIIESRLGYSVFKVDAKSPFHKKIKVAVLQRNIDPSNQTFQDTYMKASAFAGENKTPEAFEKAAIQKGIQKQQASNVREMDNNLMGLTSAREIVRWAYAENTKIGEVSPVFELTGKYVVAVLKWATPKGEQTLESVKPRIESSVKNAKKIELLVERMKKESEKTKDLYALADAIHSKVDTTVLTFSGYSRTQLGNEQEITGKICGMKTGVLNGPLTGNFGAYFVIVDEIMEALPKEDFSQDKAQAEQVLQSRVGNQVYDVLEKVATINDNRMMFY